MKKYLLIILSVCFFFACKTEDPGDLISHVPEIELLRVSPLKVVAFRDSIVFQVKYTDGDGDLGSNNDQDRNVFLTDTRAQIVHSFRIRQLGPDGATIPITGTFSIILPNTLITDNSPEQKVRFSIYVTDRAGNESNSVESEEVTVSQ